MDFIIRNIRPIILIFAIIAGNFLIYKSFSPIENILFELKQINANDLSARLKTTKNEDEINQLINEVNNLLSRLESSFERISQFSSDASHELKTPLTIIRGEIEVTLRKERTNDEYKSALNNSLNELSLIEQTVNDLLFLAKNEKDLMVDKQEEFYFDEYSFSLYDGDSEDYFSLDYRTYDVDIPEKLAPGEKLNLKLIYGFNDENELVFTYDDVSWTLLLSQSL